MKREDGELVPVGKIIGGLSGPVPGASAKPHHRRGGASPRPIR